MNNQQIEYLEQVIAAFKQCSISFVLQSGQLHHDYQISFNDIKAATGLQQLSHTIIDEYLNYFHTQRISADSDYANDIRINIDLNEVVLNPHEARDLANNIEYQHLKIMYDQI